LHELEVLLCCSTHLLAELEQKSGGLESWLFHVAWIGWVEHPPDMIIWLANLPMDSDDLIRSAAASFAPR
jgi:hypothetical protein